jgi:hypothetical protein
MVKIHGIPERDSRPSASTEIEPVRMLKYWRAAVRKRE